MWEYISRRNHFWTCHNPYEEGYTRSIENITFEDHELVFNPWEHLVEIPETERIPFGFDHIFESSSFFEFQRNGLIYRICFDDIQYRHRIIT